MYPLNKILKSLHNIHVSYDHFRVYEQYATIDAIAPGRVEIMAGRGSFTEAFDLFGYDLENYDELFIEKLEILLKMNKEEILDWKKGKFTPEVNHKEIYPRTKKPITISVATGYRIDYSNCRVRVANCLCNYWWRSAAL